MQIHPSFPPNNFIPGSAEAADVDLQQQQTVYKGKAVIRALAIQTHICMAQSLGQREDRSGSHME